MGFLPINHCPILDVVARVGVVLPFVSADDRQSRIEFPYYRQAERSFAILSSQAQGGSLGPEFVHVNKFRGSTRPKTQ
jgi:hypothetical protein